MTDKFKILLVAATPFEITPTLDWLRGEATASRQNVLEFAKAEIEVLFSGVGVAATAYVMGAWAAGQNGTKLAIQAGIGGAIDRSLRPGDVVQVTTEIFGDAGAQDKDGSWLSLGDLGFGPGEGPGADEVLRLPVGSFPSPFTGVAGITLSQATGTEAGLAQLLARWPDAQVESMEGAPFFRACLDQHVTPIQLRAISNYVGTRDRDAWEIQLAVRELNAQLRRLLEGFISAS